MKHLVLSLLLCALPGAASAASRIVSTGICSDQWVLALAPREQIAGLSKLSGRDDISAYAEEAQGIPTHNGSAEQIVALKPDLVIADSYTRRATLNVLKRLNIPTVKMPSADRLDQWPEWLHKAADALGAEKKGGILETQMQRDWQALQSIGRDPKPLAAIYRPGGYSPGIATLADDTLERIGLRNVSTERGMKSTRSLPLEWLIDSRPDFLIQDVLPERKATLAALMLDHRALRLFAQRTPKLEYQVRNWFCLSPRTLPAALALSKQVDDRL